MQNPFVSLLIITLAADLTMALLVGASWMLSGEARFLGLTGAATTKLMTALGLIFAVGCVLLLVTLGIQGGPAANPP